MEFGSLNLSIGALYLIAAMKREDQQNARNAIIEAAKQDRVTRSKAKLIIELEERKLSIEFEELCTRNRTSPAEPEPAIEPEETSRPVKKPQDQEAVPPDRMNGATPVPPVVPEPDEAAVDQLTRDLSGVEF